MRLGLRHHLSARRIEHGDDDPRLRLFHRGIPPPCRTHRGRRRQLLRHHHERRPGRRWNRLPGRRRRQRPHHSRFRPRHRGRVRPDAAHPGHRRESLWNDALRTLRRHERQLRNRLSHDALRRHDHAPHVPRGRGIHPRRAADPDLEHRLLRHDLTRGRRQPRRLRDGMRHGLPHELIGDRHHRARVRPDGRVGSDRRADPGNRRQHLRRHRRWRHVGRGHDLSHRYRGRFHDPSQLRRFGRPGLPVRPRPGERRLVLRHHRVWRTVRLWDALPDGFRWERRGPSPLRRIERGRARRDRVRHGRARRRNRRQALRRPIPRRLGRLRVPLHSRGRRLRSTARTPSCGATRWRSSS